MDLLPTSLGTRPRLAVELRPEGVVAARSEDAAALVSAVSFGVWPAGTVVPGLKPGNIAGGLAARRECVAAVKKALEAVALKERQTTLVLPDAAVRVLLLEFDALPAKAAEALPVVKFRLKKLLPFDADDAVVSYQVMSTAKGLVRVLAVAVPKDVLTEYEALVREAGFEPGAVLPSTLAACAGLDEEDESAVLLVNAGETGVTTAIVRDGILLLHRTVDLAAAGLEERMEAAAAAAAHPPAVALEVPPELLASLPNTAGPTAGETHFEAERLADEGRPLYEVERLSLVNEEDSAGEWAMQAPVTGYGVIDDSHFAETHAGDTGEDKISAEAEFRARKLAEEIAAELEDEGMLPREEMLPPLPTEREADDQRMTAAAREVTQAVSVAAAYFEDTLEMAPGLVLSAGTMGAGLLGALLRDAGFGQEEIRVMETVDPAMLTGGATTSRVPRGWMAGVRGALRS